MTDVARFKKKKSGLNLGPMGLNQAQDKVFCHFLDFGSLVFLEIAYSDSLQQCPTFSKGKTHKKMFGAQIRVRRAKIVAKINFFWYFLTFGSLVFLEIAYNDSMEQFLETNRGKIYEQKLGSPNLDQTGQNQVFLPFSEVWFFSFPGNRKE